MDWTPHDPPLLADPFVDRRRAVLVILILITALMADLFASPAGAFGPGHVTTSGFSSTEASVIASAVGRFQRASLDLPPTHIRRSGGACQRHGRTADTWPVVYITICQVDESVVVHELAHAWTFEHLGPRIRRAWNERRGAPTWLSRQEPWELRGSEQAADILTWYLYWSDFGVADPRIGGENSPQRYLADIEWLLTHGGDRRALGVFASRSALIGLTFPGTR